MTESNNIHVKLQHNNNYRRFFVDKQITFSELKKKICTLLELNSDFSIKYLDEEFEWVTIASDLELETGLVLYDKILRLLVEIKDTSFLSQSTPVESVNSSDNVPPSTVESQYVPKSNFNASFNVASSTDAPLNTTEAIVNSIISDQTTPFESSTTTTETPMDDKDDSGDANEKPWRKGRGRGRRGGKHKKYGENNRNYNKKDYKREKQNYKKGDQVENSSSSEDESLTVAEAKKLITSLSEELSLLSEKRKTLKSELFTLRESIRNERSVPNGINKEKVLELRTVVLEKNENNRKLWAQIKSTKKRITKLRNLVISKNE
jgi:hypothetical protein